MGGPMKADQHLRVVPSWRLALAPGEGHDFPQTPGWWDLRDLSPEESDDMPRLRTALLRSLPPLPDGCAVLDLGAGTGSLVTLMAAFYPRLRYTLLDANGSALERAREKVREVVPDLDVSFITESVEASALAPLPGGPFRLVTSSIALHDLVRPAAPENAPGQARHAEDHRTLLRRVLGALDPGGHFIYADAMRPGFRVMEHLGLLDEAGFTEVDCAFVAGRFLVCGGQRPNEASTNQTITKGGQ
jgi:SAM-dependent methyltransferase